MMSESRIFTMGGGRRRKLAACLIAVALSLSLAPASAAYADDGSENGGLFGGVAQAVMQFFGFGENEAEPSPQPAGEDAVADNSTINTWSEFAKSSTQTVGRIWTDKTVQTGDVTLTGGTAEGITVAKEEGADFLVGLSALSSTSNLTSVVAKPLDIVLVLDNSGSMKEGSRLGELKEAASAFAQSIAESSNPDNPHYISFVSIRNDRDKGGPYNCSTNLSTLLKDIEGIGIDEDGSSAYEKGLSRAETMLGLEKEKSENPQKVVIIIGDGDRSGYNDVFGEWTNSLGNFENPEYTDCVGGALTLKNKGTLVYSIGIANYAKADALPYNDTEALKKLNGSNVLMQAMSSNYPEASTMLQLGEPSDGNYYLVGADYNELGGLLGQIAEDIKEVAAASPTHTTDGFGSQSGYITFTDTLGDYMEVKGDEMTVVYANQPFTGKRQSDGSFVFSGEVAGNPVYQDADMANLVVKVVPGENGAGDTVTVQIPAQLIPLRNYTVDTDKDGSTTMSTKEAYPIRVFYNVGLQDGTDELLAEPDGAMGTYIDNNSVDGKVSFYSNDYTKGSEKGDTTAEFAPAKTNKFYYFTEKTPLYTDEACTKPATAQDVRGGVDTVYYKNEFYVQNGEAGEFKTEGIAIPTSAFETVHANNWDSDREGAYMKAGVPRLNRTNDFNFNKGQDGIGGNATDTAKKYIAPAWNDAENGIVVSLGNNGKLAKKLPATLAVSKTVNAADGFEAADYADTFFPFAIEVTGAANGEYKAAVTSVPAEGEATTEDVTVTFENGKATYRLKHGQTLAIYGLPAGADYTVTEDLSNIKGFAQASQNGDGKLAAGATATAAFTNTRKAEAVTLPAEEAIEIEKVLDNRDWRDTDEFTFIIKPREGTGAPSFKPNMLSIKGTDAQHTATFKDVKFENPDTYTYFLWENDPNGGKGSIPGIDYSHAAYCFTVTVDDKATPGQLEVTDTKLEQIADQEGNKLQPTEVEKASFVNRYDIGSKSVTPKVVKVYIDNSGNGYPLEDNMFEARITAKGGYVTEGGSVDSLTIDAANVPMPANAENGVARAKNTDDNFGFGAISFDGGNVGNTYVYEVAEVAGEKPIEGMAYDKHSYTVEVKVSEGDDKGQAIINTEVAIRKNGGSGELLDQVTFTNVYAPDSAVLSDSTDNAIFGIKVLEGRDAKEGETFTFELVPSEETKAAIEGGAVKGIGDKGLTATVENAKNGAESPFTFGDIEFAKVGTYTFAMSEGAPSADGEGMKYDRHSCNVTVKVTLDKETGKLEAITDYSPDNGGNTFTNTYKAESLDFDVKGGLKIVKKLTGRSIGAGEFSFVMEGVDAPSSKKLGRDDQKTAATVGSDKVDESGAFIETIKMNTGLVFTADDIGEEYIYSIKEENAGETINGVTYDEGFHTVKFAVSDGGNGVLTVAVYVDDASEPVVTYAAAATPESAEPVSVEFTNDYNAVPVVIGGEKDVKLKGTKILTGRDQVAGEFTFNVVNAKVNAADPENQEEGKVVSVGRNQADGTITFDRIEYTTDRLRQDVADRFATCTPDKDNGVDVYEYQYVITEDEAKLDKGVAVKAGTASVTVKVTDDRKGTLTAEVVSPESGLVFENTYGEQAEATIGVSGIKVLNVSGGSSKPDITGAYTFAITGVDEDGKQAPLPEKRTAANDAAGNVIFGDITYTMANVFGDSGEPDEGAGEDVPAELSAERSKTFTYTVTEEGSVPGVTNDADASKTFTVKVTDNGDGTLSVERGAQGPDFTFTNTYEARPVGPTDPDPVGPTTPADDGITIHKELTGRDLAPGEFSFELREGGKVVSTGVNDAQGNVMLEGLTFYAPGTHEYVLAEVGGGTVADGVAYDATTYALTATVTKGADGKLSVVWAAEDDTLVFRNSYTAASALVALGATKTLDGADLQDGQFTFQVIDRNGDAIRTASNDAAGVVAFEPIEFVQAGTYSYTIVERNDGQEGVTYDDASYKVVATVEDDGAGHLSATVSKDAEAAFVNVYAAPAAPDRPADSDVSDGDGDGPSDAPSLAKTNDEASPLAAMLGIAAAIAAAAAVVAAFRLSRMRHRMRR